jgi:hypothetical protein
MGEPWETKTTGSRGATLSGISILGKTIPGAKMASQVALGK